MEKAQIENFKCHALSNFPTRWIIFIVDIDNQTKVWNNWIGLIDWLNNGPNGYWYQIVPVMSGTFDFGFMVVIIIVVVATANFQDSDVSRFFLVGGCRWTGSSSDQMLRAATCNHFPTTLKALLICTWILLSFSRRYGGLLDANHRYERRAVAENKRDKR